MARTDLGIARCDGIGDRQDYMRGDLRFGDVLNESGLENILDRFETGFLHRIAVRFLT